MKKLVNLNNRTVKEWDSIVLPGKVEYDIRMFDKKIEGNHSTPHFEHHVSVAYDNNNLYATNIRKYYVKGYHTVSKKETDFCDLPNKYQKAVTDFFRCVDKDGGTVFDGCFNVCQNEAKIDSVFVGSTGVIIINISLYVGK